MLQCECSVGREVEWHTVIWYSHETEIMDVNKLKNINNYKM